MSLLLPLGLLALLSVPVLIALHFLRPERRQLRVPSAALWRDALNQPRMSGGWRRLLSNLSLLLVVLGALLASLALADPRWFRPAASPSDLVLVVDNSASMQAADSGGTRLERAISAARERIDELPRGGRALIITAGARPRLASALSTERRRLEEALDGIEPTDEAGRPGTALALAASLLPDPERGRVVFFTDLAFDGEALARAPGIEVVNVAGTQTDNVAITGFDVRAEMGLDNAFQVLVTVANFSAVQRTVPVAVGNGQRAMAVRDLSLAANASATFVFALEETPPPRLTVQLEVEDALAVDNRAVLVPRREDEIRVLLHSAGSFYLESVLAALPNVVVYRRTEQDLERFGLRDDGQVGQFDLQSFDVAVFDRVTPPRMPSGNYLLIDTLPRGLGLEPAPPVNDPPVTYRGEGSVMDGLDFDGLRIDVARGSRPSPGASGVQSLLASGDINLAALTVQGGRRVVHLGFDPADSNFPLKSAYPLFVSRALEWLNSGRGARLEQPARTGDIVSLPASARSGTLVVRTPDGEGVSVRAVGGEARLDATTRAGLYRYRLAGVEREFALNLLDAVESDIRPRAQSSAAPVDVVPEAAAVVETALWRWLALLVFVVLAIEWGVRPRESARA